MKLTNIQNNQLLTDINKYGQKGKAKLVYNKCLRNSKLNLANKIKIKYSLHTIYDDTVDSLLLLSYYLKNKK